MNKKLFTKRRGSLTALSAAILAGACFMGTPEPAQAYMKCDPSDLCMMTTRQEAEKTRSRITDMERSLTRVVLESVERILGALREQTGALTASEAQNTQAAGENVQKVQQAADMQSAKDRHTSMMCGATSPAQGGRGGGISRPNGGGGDSVPPGSKLSDQTVASIKNGVAQKAVAPENATYAQTTTGVGACIDFADPSSALGQLCKQIGAPSQGKNPYLDADINSSTLFEGPNSQTSDSSILSVPESGPEADARAAHLNMLFEANPIEMPNKDALSKIALAGPFMGLYREYRAGKDMAAYGSKLFNRLSTIDPETKLALDAVKTKDSKFYSEFFKGVDPKFYSNGVSPLTLLELQTESRVGNKEWLKEMSKASPEVKQNEQVAMQALDMRIQYQRLVAQYQTNVLLGKLLDMQVESTLRPRLDRYIEDMSVTKAKAGSQTAQGGAAPAGN